MAEEFLPHESPQSDKAGCRLQGGRVVFCGPISARLSPRQRATIRRQFLTEPEERASVNNLGLQTVRAVCPHDCPDTCGMIVTVQDGRAVQLRGDRDHPFTKGFLCQKVARYLDRVYHRDRLQWPMKRVGPKGTGRFARITWDEALDTITTRFADI